MYKFRTLKSTKKNPALFVCQKQIYICHIVDFVLYRKDGIMVFNATFNNILYCNNQIELNIHVF